MNIHVKCHTKNILTFTYAKREFIGNLKKYVIMTSRINGPFDISNGWDLVKLRRRVKSLKPADPAFQKNLRNSSLSVGLICKDLQCPHRKMVYGSWTSSRLLSYNFCNTNIFLCTGGYIKHMPEVHVSVNLHTVFAAGGVAKTILSVHTHQYPACLQHVN